MVADSETIRWAFTEERIRTVMDRHHPVNGMRIENPQCSCASEWVPRERCFYCKTKVGEAHHPKCSRPFPTAGQEQRRGPVDFDVEHFIDALKTEED